MQTQVISQKRANQSRISKLYHSKSAELQIGDCRDILPKIPSSSVHLVLTDPPYFLHRLDSKWNQNAIKASCNSAGVIGGLPVGMRFDPLQGINLQAFLSPIALELFRILKPGGFLLLFAAPRLYHRAAIAIEDAGFEIRDSYVWHYTKRAQFKAFTVDHFVRKRADMTKRKKEQVIKELGGRRTPQLRPQFEPILCAQKPKEGTFVENWLSYQTGLIDPRESLTERVPETVMKVEKPSKDCNSHLTPKPIRLCEHLIKLFSSPKQLVLDPFVGSGTTCVAAFHTDRRSIGIDSNAEFIEIAKHRLEAAYDSSDGDRWTGSKS